jgi:hypothetical protein
VLPPQREVGRDGEAQGQRVARAVAALCGSAGLPDGLWGGRRGCRCRGLFPQHLLLHNNFKQRDELLFLLLALLQALLQAGEHGLCGCHLSHVPLHILLRHGTLLLRGAGLPLTCLLLAGLLLAGLLLTGLLVRLLRALRNYLFVPPLFSALELIRKQPKRTQAHCLGYVLSPL